MADSISHTDSLPDQLKERERFNTVYDALSHHQRRFILYRLFNQETPVTFDELVQEVAAAEHETPHTELPSKTINAVHVSLHHNHLPYLDELGLVVYDQEQNRVDLPDDQKLLPICQDYLLEGD